MVVRTEKAGYTVLQSKVGEMIRLDEPYVMEGLPECQNGKAMSMQQIWREAACYQVKAYGEDLSALIKRSVVLYHVPAFDTAPTALARILSRENPSWRVFQVRIMEDTERFYFSLILKAGISSERYQVAEMGLDFGKLTDMAIKIVKKSEDGSIHEVAYKRARDEETGLQRTALAFLVEATEECRGIDIDAL